MAGAWARWANPSSPHAEGRAARALLEEARARTASALGWTGEVVFTSGATEAAHLAVAGRRVALAATEHEAIRRAAGPDAETVPVDHGGLVGPEECAAADAGLVAVAAANGETGVLQPLGAIAGAVRAAGKLLLADCSQSAGKIALPDADLVIVSAHKLGGPPGVGALLVRDLGLLAPTGGQERGYRGGTENLPAILGFAAALEADRGWVAKAGRWRARLEDAARAAGAEVVAGGSPRLPSLGALRLPGMAAVQQIIALDLAGIAVSAGSACSSASMRPSPVLAAMGWPEAAAREVIRVSFGWSTRGADIERLLDAWLPLARRAAA